VAKANKRITTTAPVAPVTPEAPAQRYARRTWGLDDVITLLVASNPKRGASYGRFACYGTGGITVRQYVQAVVDGGHKGGATKAHADLRWDVAHKLVAIAAPAKADAPAAE